MPRFYPELPVCAVGAIIFQEGKVLLIKRGHPPAEGRWSIPGGVVHLGESLETALHREVMEELGVEIRILKVGRVLDRIERDAQGEVYYHFVIIDYVCDIPAGVPRADSDAAAAGFFRLEELEGLDMTEGTAQVIREVFQARQD
jgi:8-oxo-dGTP diphosphatase